MPWARLPQKPELRHRGSAGRLWPRLLGETSLLLAQGTTSLQEVDTGHGWGWGGSRAEQGWGSCGPVGSASPPPPGFQAGNNPSAGLGPKTDSEALGPGSAHLEPSSSRVRGSLCTALLAGSPCPGFRDELRGNILPGSRLLVEGPFSAGATGGGPRSGLGSSSAPRLLDRMQTQMHTSVHAGLCTHTSTHPHTGTTNTLAPRRSPHSQAKPPPNPMAGGFPHAPRAWHNQEAPSRSPCLLLQRPQLAEPSCPCSWPPRLLTTPPQLRASPCRSQTDLGARTWNQGRGKGCSLQPASPQGA